MNGSKRASDWRVRSDLGVLAGLAIAACSATCWGADNWGGSLSATSDYLVRGITRSDDQAVLQGDLHVVQRSGFLAGVFASEARYQPQGHTTVELSGFVGFAWRHGDDWQEKIVLNHYFNPWLRGRWNYDYDEVTVDATFRDWLGLSVAYSPNYRRYVPYRGLIGTTNVAADANLQIPLRWRLALIGGVGYSYFGGPEADGYIYGSAGLGLDFSPWAFAISYMADSSEAKYLFYNAGSGSRWVGSAVFRFH